MKPHNLGLRLLIEWLKNIIQNIGLECNEYMNNMQLRNKNENLVIQSKKIKGIPWSFMEFN
jgi:hypothetical protein